MNISKRCWFSAVTLAATLSLPAVLLAQDAAKTPPASPSAEGPKKRPTADQVEAMRAQRDAWIKELGASEEQLTKIRAAVKEQGDKSRELRADTNLSQEDRRAKMQAIRETMTAKMKEVLTPDQFAKYEKLQEQRREQMSRGEGRRPQPGAPKPDGSKPEPAKPQTTK